MRVGIMGLGEIGTANKHYLRGLGIDVIGYDPMFHPDFNLPICDAYVICPSSDRILDACRLIKSIDENPLLLIESTARVGTSRMIYEMFKTNAQIVYCPQRYWGKDPQGRGVRRHRLISAFNEHDLSVGISWYKKVFDIPVYPVSSPEVAEMAKFIENAYRGVQIAFAQELKEYADRLDLDFNEIREAVMTADDMHYIPEARDGIGGHCIPMAMNWVKEEMPLVYRAVVSDALYKKYIEENTK